MHVAARRTRTLIAAMGLSLAPVLPASADLLSSLLPGDVPGYDTQDGVTVQSRLHPGQGPSGLRAGTFQFWPTLDESVGYTTNALPGPYRRGSWEVLTNPSLVAGSDWSRDAFGISLSVLDTRYLGLPAQSRTDGRVEAGGRLDFGQDSLTLAMAHVAQHEDRGEVGTLATDTPIGFTADNLSASYAATNGRWTIMPGLRVTNWAYNPTTIMGVPTTQAYRDRVALQGDITLRYEWAPLRNLLFIVRAFGQDYTRPSLGMPTENARGQQMLTGLDYDDDAVWHWRLLVGGETRSFESSLYAPQNNLIADAAVTWTPTGLTTLGASISREATDAAQEGVSGMMFTTARLTIDHEYLRNLLLHASMGLQRADFFQGGYQTGTVAGLGMTWILNRSMRLSATYDQTDLHGSSNPAFGLLGGYSRGIGLITLRLGL